MLHGKSAEKMVRLTGHCAQGKSFFPSCGRDCNMYKVVRAKGAGMPAKQARFLLYKGFLV